MITMNYLNVVRIVGCFILFCSAEVAALGGEAQPQRPAAPLATNLVAIDKILGTWKLNLEKSEMPKYLALTNYMFTFERVQSSLRVVGNRASKSLILKSDYLVALDGSWTPAKTGKWEWKLDRVDARKFKLRGRFVRDSTQGEEVETFTLSDDGKSMGLITQRYNVVLDKQP